MAFVKDTGVVTIADWDPTGWARVRLDSNPRQLWCLTDITARQAQYRGLVGKRISVEYVPEDQFAVMLGTID